MTDEYRPYGLWTAVALVIGGMIGTGIFVLPSQLAPFGWTGVAAWGCAIAGSLLLVWVIFQLTLLRPHADGAVTICAEALGPIPGVLIGWSYWVANCAGNAVFALGAARYLAVLIPPLAATPLSAALTANVILWGLTFINFRGLRGVGILQIVTTVLKLVPLLAVLAILAGLGVIGGGQFQATPHAAYESAQLTPALGIVFFAMLGFESASLVAARLRDPARNVGRAMLIGTALSGLIFVIVSTGVIFALPTDQVANSGAPVALFMSHFWGQSAGLILAGFAAVSAIGALNGWILVQGELPLGMIRSGLLPAWLGKTNAHDVPIVLQILSSGTSCALILSGLSRTTSGLLDFMERVTTASNLWLYLGCCGAAFVFRVARPVAALGLGFTLWVMVGAGWEALRLSIGLMLVALPLYWLSARGLAEQPT